MTTIIRRVAGAAAFLIAAIAAAVLIAALARRNGDMPWTPLDLGAPLGSFTRPKLVALRDDAAGCHALIARTGARFAVLPDRTDTADCGYAGAVQLDRGGARPVQLSPARVPLSCPLAAAELMWEWDVVGPASVRLLGSPVVAIRHVGSYNCRRLYGRAMGPFSEHARADAIDIAGFTLADGRTITVARDWRADDAGARFLHAVRDGACKAFATVLSPDYNAAHADHFHLDQAARGAAGIGACH